VRKKLGDAEEWADAWEEHRVVERCGFVERIDALKVEDVG